MSKFLSILQARLKRKKIYQIQSSYYVLLRVYYLRRHLNDDCYTFLLKNDCNKSSTFLWIAPHRAYCRVLKFFLLLLYSSTVFILKSTVYGECSHFHFYSLFLNVPSWIMEQYVIWMQRRCFTVFPRRSSTVIMWKVRGSTRWVEFLDDLFRHHQSLHTVPQKRKNGHAAILADNNKFICTIEHGQRTCLRCLPRASTE